MARELDITITVNDGGAKEHLAGIDAAADRAAASVGAMHGPLTQLEARLQKAAAASRLTAEQLQAVKAQLQAGIDPRSIDVMAGSLQKAEKASTDVGTSMKTTKVAIQETGAAAKEVAAENGGFGQLQTMATRVVERMAILFALRGTFQFVEGIIQAAHETQALAAGLGVSTDTIQELQYAAGQSDVPFSVLTGAVDSLQKKLGEGSSGLIKALTDVGLSYETLKHKSPDEALRATAEAIGSIQDHFERAGAEAQIFGSDKIDPVLTKMGALRKEAHDTGVVLSTEQNAALADIAKGWSLATDRAKTYFAEVAAHGIPGGSKNGQYLPGIQPGTPGSQPLNLGGLATGFPNANVATGAGGAPPSAFGVTGPMNLGGLSPVFQDANISAGAKTDFLFGDAAAAQLAKIRTELEPLTNGQRLYLEQLKAIGQLTLQNASAYNINNDQLEKYKRDVEAITKLEQEQASLEEVIFRGRVRILKETSDEMAKQTAAWVKLSTAATLAELKAKEDLAARQGLTVTGNALSTGNPVTDAQLEHDRKVSDLRRDTPQGFSTQAQEALLFAQLQDKVQALWTSTDGLKDAQDGVAPSARAAASGLDTAGRASYSAAGAFQQFASQGSSVFNADGSARRTDAAGARFDGKTFIDYAMHAGNVPINLAGGLFQSFDNGGPIGQDGPIFAHAGEMVVPRGGMLVKGSGGGSGSVSVGDIHIHGNVDSELQVRRLASQTADEVLRRLNQSNGRRTYTTN